MALVCERAGRIRMIPDLFQRFFTSLDKKRLPSKYGRDMNEARSIARHLCYIVS